jgi:hypothetical protein
MTYNFDPDRWYENELASIRSRHTAGDINRIELEKAIEDLDHRYADMWKRLDGSYRVFPGGK